MIDLHTHTNHSDGTDSVSKLLAKANQINMEILSITDHDSVGAYYELEQNPEIRKLFNGKIIVGTELKTLYNKVSIEVLAYGIDYKKLRIHKVNTEKVQKEILIKFKSIAKNIGLKFNEDNLYIDLNDPTKQYASFVLANELLKHKENRKIISIIGEFSPHSFFRVHQSNQESPFYVDETENSISLNETISRIHEVGGLAFLAHGWLYPFKDVEKIVEEILVKTDIDGLECMYSEFSKEQTNIFINLCKKHNKFMSGGTDYHANNKPHITLGTGINNNLNINKSFINNWVDKVRMI